MNPRKGSLYVFEPVLGDWDQREYKGYVVRVIGCPGMPNAKAPKTFRYIETLAGHVIGMVYRTSLVAITDENDKTAAKRHAEHKTDLVLPGWSIGR